MPETRLKLNLIRLRKGQHPEAVKTYSVLGRKPAGGMVARVIIEAEPDLRKHGTSIFDFTYDPFKVP
jgi:hypothetical protein